ncbi:hypothetical protein K457DRAFT_157153 [Linnemannia elongata AG-77]|uniref:Helicase C-terminal domain-containing protein n=1 Tax=Linnemannia elongata AG-77 TaxID=1314771 RepID=A0A197JPC9_9FUNG|nr:hypothetical protein K457DRAFT_157153 [Linnemannia elongata AG-77]
MAPSDDQQDGDLIPIGSWDTSHPTVAAHFKNGDAPRFSTKPFLGSGDNSDCDFLMIQALGLLQQLGVLSYSEHHRVDQGPPKQHLTGTRILIYAHDRQRPSNRLYQSNKNHGRKATEETAEAKRALALVLFNMNVDPWSFHHPTMDTSSAGQRQTVATLFQNNSNKRLIDIYMEMPSPRASDDPYRDQPIRSSSKATERLLQQAIELDSPRGMRTKLYQYQKNSLWKLLRRELCPDLMLDPLTVTLQDMNGKPYYLDLAIEEPFICREPATVWEDIPGGIICEDMGTGKTCLCIALILHTLHQSGRPPADEPVQLLCDILPSTPSAATVDSDIKEMVLPRGTAIPSLRDFAAATVKTRAVNYRHAQDYINPDIMDTLEDALLYYRESGSSEQSRQSRSRQTRTSELPVEIYISSATLVIVPPNLVDQWCNEINKHTEDGALKVFTITNNSQEFPNLRTLLHYDLVLISQNRFAKEYTPGPYSMKRALDKTNCQCSIVYDRCRCLPPRAISPLMQIRWKRIIVDEGHSMGMRMSDHALHAEKLHADRRWICTGTPTTNLANLDPSSMAGVHGSGNNYQQVASSDRVDMDRLSVLVESFLHLPPYTFDRSRFSKELQRPLLDHQHQYYATTMNGDGSSLVLSGGPKARHEWTLEGASSVLRLKYLMDRIMVRNRPEDVARNVTLPPLQERIVSLDLEYFQVLALNCQIALIQANAVLSEREDQDYLLHPSNRTLLTKVIENLKDGCFWYLGGIGYKDRVVDSLSNVMKALEKDDMSGGTKYSREDRRLLLDIVRHLTTALESPGWEAIVAAQEVGYYCQDLPTLVQAKHALIPSTLLHNTNSGLIHGEPLERRQVQGDAEGALCVVLGREISDLRDKVLSAERTADIERLHHQDDAQLLNASITSTIDTAVNDNANAEQMLKEVMSRERLSRSTILSSTSSKLNYIASQILQHQGSEKCIVFCQNQTVMYYIREYLELAKVRCLMYHTGMTEREKSSNITTFNTSEVVSTIIMDTGLAAYGIDLSSASRVYFVSPVWKTATLRQAIKRAHRIGQVRPVFVETLVIRDSFEEKILNRRREIDDNPRGESMEPAPSSLSPFGGDVGESSSSSALANHRHRSRHQRRKIPGRSGSAATMGHARSKKDMLDDGKVQDLIRNLEFMTNPKIFGQARGGEGDARLSEAPHNISTLADYALLGEGGIRKDLATKYRIPVVRPAKESALAHEQLRMAREEQDAPSVVDIPFEHPPNETVVKGGGSSGKKKLCFEMDTDMEVVDQETNEFEDLALPKQESNQEDRHPSESAEELAARAERHQKQELELRMAKEEVERAQSHVRAAQERLLRIKQQQKDGDQGQVGSSVGTVIVLDNDDDDVAEVVEVDLKKEGLKDVRLKFENIKLEGSSSFYSLPPSRRFKFEQEDKKVKFEEKDGKVKFEREDKKVKFEVKTEDIKCEIKAEDVKAEDVKYEIKAEDVKRPFTFKSEDDDHRDNKGFKREQTPAPAAEYYELFDHDDGGEEKKFKVEEGTLSDDAIIILDSDSDETMVSVPVVGLKAEVTATTAVKSERAGGDGISVKLQGLDDMTVDLDVDVDTVPSMPLLQQHAKRENSQPHHPVDLQAESRLKKRVRF